MYIDDRYVVAEAQELNAARDFQQGYDDADFDLRKGRNFDPLNDNPVYLAGYNARSNA